MGSYFWDTLYYCSDPAYAITFSNCDGQTVAVLECSVKKNSFEAYPGTVPGYKPHEDDDPNGLEWRFTNPAAIEIISILFIPAMNSRMAAVKTRIKKFGIDPNAM